MLLSVPMELNTDHLELLAVAQQIGYVSEAQLRVLRTWPAERFAKVINLLLVEGVVWVDDCRGGCGIPSRLLHACVVNSFYSFCLCLGERRYEFPSIQVT